jgi:electron transport complex protein RnfC
MYWYSRAKDLEKVQDYHLFDCIECGCCSHVCPSHIPLVQYFRYAKTELWARERDRERSDLARQRFEARNARIEGEKEARRRKLEEKTKSLEEARGDDAARKALIDKVLEEARSRKDKAADTAGSDD